jgi:glutamyl-tRNA synthetase
VLTDLGLSKKQIRGVMGACYAVVEGVSRGLPLFESIVLLGRERTLIRLRAARDRLG